MSPKCLLEVDRHRVREKFGKSDREAQDYIDIIKNWFDQQPHLPEVPSDELIEYFLVSNKYSTEETKAKLDMYYTVRSLIPEIFSNNQPYLPHMQEIAKVILNGIMPKLTPELYRVSISKIIGDPSEFQPYWFFAHLWNHYEIRLHEDLNMGDIFVFDFQEIKLGHVLKMTPILVRKGLIILEKVLSNRMKGLHLVNSPPFTDIFVKMLKAVMKPKLFERVHIHMDADLSSYFSKDVLPKDYGGQVVSLDEINDLWKGKLENYKERYDKLNNMTVDESLRPTPLVNTEILGYYGTFKKLDID